MIEWWTFNKFDLNSVWYKSIVKWLSLTHLLNALFPILETEEGIVISDKEEHPSKALLAISVTDDGILIEVNDVHL